MHSRVLEDDEVLECGQGDSFLTINVIPSLQGGKGGEWDWRPRTWRVVDAGACGCGGGMGVVRSEHKEV